MSIKSKTLRVTEQLLASANIGAFWFLVLAAIVSLVFVAMAAAYPAMAIPLVAFKVVGPF